MKTITIIIAATRRVNIEKISTTVARQRRGKKRKNMYKKVISVATDFPHSSQLRLIIERYIKIHIYVYGVLVICFLSLLLPITLACRILINNEESMAKYE